MRSFYCDELGLPYEELLKVGGGVHQHRLGLHGSVLKVNASREPLANAPTNFARLDVHGPRARGLRDPDGNHIVVSPDVDTIAIHWAASTPDRLVALLH